MLLENMDLVSDIIFFFPIWPMRGPVGSTHGTPRSAVDSAAADATWVGGPGAAGPCVSGRARVRVRTCTGVRACAYHAIQRVRPHAS